MTLEFYNVFPYYSAVLLGSMLSRIYFQCELFGNESDCLHATKMIGVPAGRDVYLWDDLKLGRKFAHQIFSVWMIDIDCTRPDNLNKFEHETSDIAAFLP